MPLDARIVGASAVVSYARSALSQARNLVVVVGAGLSTSAGVPDFRSPDTGLYASLRAAGVEDPQEIFNAQVFRDEPELFWSVAHLFFRSACQPLLPTKTHGYLAALDAGGTLLRVYTQNVDGLEVAAGVTAPRVVAAHGSFRFVRCGRSACGAREASDAPRIAAAAAARTVPTCTRPRCRGVMRPDVVFFGEPLVGGWTDRSAGDIATADGVLVAGTSLSVAPLSTYHMRAREGVPRIFINRYAAVVENGGVSAFDAVLLGEVDDIFSLLFGEEKCSDCDDDWEWIVDGSAARLVRRYKNDCASAGAGAGAGESDSKTKKTVSAKRRRGDV